MESRQGQDLRAQVNTSVLYRVVNIAFVVLFIGAVLSAVFNNQSEGLLLNWPVLLLAAVLGVGLTFGASRLFSFIPSPGKLAERLAVAGGMALIAALCFVVGFSLLETPSPATDFGMVYQRASAYVLQGALPDNYFLYYPTHTGLYVLFCGFFSIVKLFGVTDFAAPLMVLNILAVCGAILLMYFCARRLFGVKKALYILAASLLAVPFLMAGPVVYTYTLTMPVPVAVMLLWMKTRGYWRGGDSKKAVIYFTILSGVVAVGALIKMTVLIIYIAVLLDLLLLLCGRGRWKVLLPGLGACVAVLAIGFLVYRFGPMLPRYDKNADGIPATSWLIMGLSEKGGYNEEDLNAILSRPDMAARKAFVSEEIGNRIGDYMPFGLLGHLSDKLAYTFGDPTMGLAGQLSAAPSGGLREWFLPYGSGYAALSFYAFGIQIAVLVWMVVAAVKSLYRKNDALTFARLASLGLLVFLLIWKTEPGEVLPFFPVFLLCALEASPAPLLAMQKKRARQALQTEALLPQAFDDAARDSMNEELGQEYEQGWQDANMELLSQDTDWAAPQPAEHMEQPQEPEFAAQDEWAQEQAGETLFDADESYAAEEQDSDAADVAEDDLADQIFDGQVDEQPFADNQEQEYDIEYTTEDGQVFYQQPDGRTYYIAEDGQAYYFPQAEEELYYDENGVYYDPQQGAYAQQMVVDGPDGAQVYYQDYYEAPPQGMVWDEETQQWYVDPQWEAQQQDDAYAYGQEWQQNEEGADSAQLEWQEDGSADELDAESIEETEEAREAEEALPEAEEFFDGQVADEQPEEPTTEPQPLFEEETELVEALEELPQEPVSEQPVDGEAEEEVPEEAHPVEILPDLFAAPEEEPKEVAEPDVVDGEEAALPVEQSEPVEEDAADDVVEERPAEELAPALPDEPQEALEPELTLWPDVEIPEGNSTEPLQELEPEEPEAVLETEDAAALDVLLPVQAEAEDEVEEDSEKELAEILPDLFAIQEGQPDIAGSLAEEQKTEASVAEAEVAIETSEQESLEVFSLDEPLPVAQPREITSMDEILLMEEESEAVSQMEDSAEEEPAIVPELTLWPDIPELAADEEAEEETQEEQPEQPLEEAAVLEELAQEENLFAADAPEVSEPQEAGEDEVKASDEAEEAVPQEELPEIALELWPEEEAETVVAPEADKGTQPEAEPVEAAEDEEASEAVELENAEEETVLAAAPAQEDIEEETSDAVALFAEEDALPEQQEDTAEEPVVSLWPDSDAEEPVEILQTDDMTPVEEAPAEDTVEPLSDVSEPEQQETVAASFEALEEALWQEDDVPTALDEDSEEEPSSEGMNDDEATREMQPDEEAEFSFEVAPVIALAADEDDWLLEDEIVAAETVSAAEIGPENAEELEAEEESFEVLPVFAMPDDEDDTQEEVDWSAFALFSDAKTDEETLKPELTLWPEAELLGQQEEPVVQAPAAEWKPEAVEETEAAEDLAQVFEDATDAEIDEDEFFFAEQVQATPDDFAAETAADEQNDPSEEAVADFEEAQADVEVMPEAKEERKLPLWLEMELEEELRKQRQTEAPEPEEAEAENAPRVTEDVLQENEPQVQAALFEQQLFEEELPAEESPIDRPLDAMDVPLDTPAMADEAPVETVQQEEALQEELAAPESEAIDSAVAEPSIAPQESSDSTPAKEPAEAVEEIALPVVKHSVDEIIAMLDAKRLEEQRNAALVAEAPAFPQPIVEKPQPETEAPVAATTLDNFTEEAELAAPEPAPEPEIQPQAQPVALDAEQEEMIQRALEFATGGRPAIHPASRLVARPQPQKPQPAGGEPTPIVSVAQQPQQAQPIQQEQPAVQEAAQVIQTPVVPQQVAPVQAEEPTDSVLPVTPRQPAPVQPETQMGTPFNVATEIPQPQQVPQTELVQQPVIQQVPVPSVPVAPQPAVPQQVAPVAQTLVMPQQAAPIQAEKQRDTVLPVTPLQPAPVQPEDQMEAPLPVATVTPQPQRVQPIQPVQPIIQQPTPAAPVMPQPASPVQSQPVPSEPVNQMDIPLPVVQKQAQVSLVRQPIQTQAAGTDEWNTLHKAINNSLPGEQRYIVPKKPSAFDELMKMVDDVGPKDKPKQ